MEIARALEHNALWQLTRARTMGFLREPEAVFWVFVFPILLALALGIAFRTQKPQPLPVGVAAGTTAAVREALATAAELRVVPLASDAEAERALRNGTIVALVHGEAGASRVVYDPTRQENQLARMLIEDTLQRAAGREDPARIEAITRTQRGTRYIDFLLPGLIGMNLLGTGMWGVGFPIATARQQKLLKRYMATPMRRGEYLLSFLFARLLWLLLEVAALCLFGRLVFGIGMDGSWPAFISVVLAGALSFSALGLLVVSRAKTIEAVSGLMNVAMLPMWLLSGTFFASSRFPQVVQPFVQALPLTAVNNSLRALMNDGLGFAAVTPSLALLAAWGLVSFVVALRIFRWE